MKRLVKWTAASLAGVVAIAVCLIGLDAMDKQKVDAHLKQEDAPVIKEGWTGNPVDEKGRFMNDEFPYLPRVVDILKWKVLDRNEFKDAKNADRRRLAVEDPVPFLSGAEDGIMWMGHASFFIRVDGVSIVTDPVYGDPAFLTRFVPVRSPIDQVANVDIILISHDHRDHLDENSIRQLTAKFPNATIVAGLRSEDLLHEWAPSNPIRTLGWFQQTTAIKDIRITFVPVRHWSRRGLTDMNWRLWGGYVIEGSKHKVYFGGDSGYGRHYQEVGELFPKIDYFLVGIGAYEPRWFMEPNHNTPGEALNGCVEARASTMIPMHYGTFDLSDEPPGQPLEDLLDEATRRGLRDRVRPLPIYGSLPFPQ